MGDPVQETEVPAENDAIICAVSSKHIVWSFPTLIWPHTIIGKHNKSNSFFILQ